MTIALDEQRDGQLTDLLRGGPQTDRTWVDIADTSRGIRAIRVMNLRTMSAAALGLVGVVVGFMLGRGYEYWTVHRAELSAAIAATAALAEELRGCFELEAEGRHPAKRDCEGAQSQAPQRFGTREHLHKAWEEHRSALTVFMWPSDVLVLAEAVRSAPLGTSENGLDPLSRRMHELHILFWTEQQLFILVAFLRLIPPIRQLSGYRSVPARIHEKLTPQALPSADSGGDGQSSGSAPRRIS